MSCKDCFSNCPSTPSDCCVVYTGADIPALGICSGDRLCDVEKIIIERLLTVIDGTGITLGEITLENCEDVKTLMIGKDVTLANLLQVLIDNQCTLKELIEDITPTSSSFNISCLTGLPTNPTTEQIIQALITTVCAMKTIVDALPSTYVKISDINTYINNYLTAQANTTEYYKSIPSKVALPYFGDLSKFDTTGKGLESQGFKNIYICNGANGTPDLRGRAVVGAVKNIPGGSLDVAVDPALISNPNSNHAIGDKFGSNYVTLTTSEMPTHAHTVTDPGHTHTYEKLLNAGHPSGSSNTNPRNASGANTGLAYTGISINNAGDGEAHENRQPSIAACWIMAIY